MPRSIPSPNLKTKLEHLSRDTFAPFGTVIQNPAHTSASKTSPSPKSNAPLKSIEANQGSATKYIDVSYLTNHYGSAPSGKTASSVVNMFVCKPRKLRRRKPSAELVTDQVVGSEMEHVFDVGIMERHPFTPQTFVPMGVAQGDVKTKYLVIVAPTLPEGSKTASNRTLRRMQSIFFPWNSSSSPSSDSTLPADAPRPKGTGLPDLRNAKAFLADGSQAVTYGPGTWHAPMVVLGDKPIDFVVIQYANGVGDEDCQEVLLQSEPGQEGLIVVVEVVPESPEPLRAKL